MERRRSHPRITRSWLVTFALSWVLWLVLGGSLARSEVLAGAGVAALAATVAALAGAGAPAAARPRAADAAAVARALAAVPGDHLRLVRHLSRELRGQGSRGRFEVVPGRGPVAPAAASLSPERYAIASDDEHGTMLVHRLGQDGGDPA